MTEDFVGVVLAGIFITIAVVAGNYLYFEHIADEPTNLFSICVPVEGVMVCEGGYTKEQVKEIIHGP